MSMAWPVPTATTLVSTPVACLNAGSRWPNKPDCSVDVVDAMVMDWAITAGLAAMNAIETIAICARQMDARGLKRLKDAFMTTLL